MPRGASQEDTNQLTRTSVSSFISLGSNLGSLAVTHERIRHRETQEVHRVKEVDRHSKQPISLTRSSLLTSMFIVHHIQHHIQPVVASETLVEQISEYVRRP
jgi:hypothetical protein